MTRSTARTRGVRVDVEARYSPEHSKPGQGLWFFLYTVRITNEGTETCQLVSRHWIIRNATGKVQEVRGPGVVGEQPALDPGESFEYTSGCPLDTPIGSMEGSYDMVTREGAHFEARVARFALHQPQALH